MNLRTFRISGTLGSFFCIALPLAAQAAHDQPGVSGPVNGPTLSLADAEAHALKNQPRLAAEDLRAQATGKRVQQSRSSYFPQLIGNLTAVQSNGDSAVAAAPSQGPRRWQTDGQDRVGEADRAVRPAATPQAAIFATSAGDIRTSFS